MPDKYLIFETRLDGSLGYWCRWKGISYFTTHKPLARRYSTLSAARGQRTKLLKYFDRGPDYNIRVGIIKEEAMAPNPIN